MGLMRFCGNCGIRMRFDTQFESRKASNYCDRCRPIMAAAAKRNRDADKDRERAFAAKR